MVNRLTSTEMFTPKSEPTPAPVTEPDSDHAGLAERLRLGALDDRDEAARVNGTLGGTTDAADLNAKLTQATGGHDNVTPVGRLEPPAVPSVAALHPSITDLSVVKASELARAQAEHEAAKNA